MYIYIYIYIYIHVRALRDHRSPQSGRLGATKKPADPSDVAASRRVLAEEPQATINTY